MGGLVVYHHNPAPNYVWEMLYVDTGELFMHFDVRISKWISRPKVVLLNAHSAFERLHSYLGPMTGRVIEEAFDVI